MAVVALQLACMTCSLVFPGSHDGWQGLRPASAQPLPAADVAISPWKRLIDQAAALGLPTRFLQAMPVDFVTVEFEDLHAFAAEYHPDEHRMVLNQALSFNAAGGMLRPLTSLPHRDVGTLYHELFHAYLDYVRTQTGQANADKDASRALAFAESQRRCRYQTVNIAPVVQRPTVTEARYLSDRESWEALNETWAVFIGWAVWSRLEVGGPGPFHRKPHFEKWIKRLARAERDGDLIGYYEPDDASERAVARKRYLARTDRISPDEVRFLLELVLEVPSSESQRVTKALQGIKPACQESPSGESRGHRP